MCKMYSIAFLWKEKKRKYFEKQDKFKVRIKNWSVLLLEQIKT